MKKQLSPNGFNLYRNGKFWFVVQTETDEQKAIEHIKSYIKVNNYNAKEFTYKQFMNHTSEGFELKQIPN